MIENPQSELSDAVLVARARAGDTDAYGLLYRHYLDPVYRYLLVRLGDSKDAEDLAEEVFIRSFQALGNYRERGLPFSAFLYQVAKNMLIDHYRRQKPVAELQADEPASATLRPLDERIIRNEQLGDVRRAMESIPSNYREVIILRVILAMPTSVVADWMSLTEGATRVLLHRALASLRGRLQEQT